MLQTYQIEYSIVPKNRHQLYTVNMLQIVKLISLHFFEKVAKQRKQYFFLMFHDHKPGLDLCQRHFSFYNVLI